jgi:cell division septum initiation protein DivIVA
MDQSPAQPAATAAVSEITGDGTQLMGEEGDLHAYSGFDGALRGYDRRQVNKYVSRTQRRLEELTAELGTVRRNEQVLATRVDELSKTASLCTCDPSKPESAVVGARLRQIIDIATAEADDLRSRAEAECKAMREESENALVNAREQAEQATSALDAMLAHRRAAEEAAEAERRAALEGWAERHVSEARETARRVIERAGAVSSQVIASARWLVDALGAHRDALSEQLGGVQRRIDELPSLEAAAAVPGEQLAAGPADDQPAVETPAANRPDEASQPVRAVVRVPGAHAAHAADQAPPGTDPDGPTRGNNPASPPGVAVSPAAPPAHAAPGDTATLNRTWTPVNPRIGGAHRG